MREGPARFNHNFGFLGSCHPNSTRTALTWALTRPENIDVNETEMTAKKQSAKKHPSFLLSMSSSNSNKHPSGKGTTSISTASTVAFFRARQRRRWSRWARRWWRPVGCGWTWWSASRSSPLKTGRNMMSVKTGKRLNCRLCYTFYSLFLKLLVCHECGLFQN